MSYVGFAKGPYCLFNQSPGHLRSDDNLEKVFEHELGSYPPALFESKWTPRSGCKATLADVLWKYMPEQKPAPE